MKQHVYIIGSKGIPARYGGYETFVDKLTAGQQDKNIQYHVAARSDNSEFGGKPSFSYNGAEVFNINVPNIGPAQAIIYDIKALKWAIADAKKKEYYHPIFYVLACRIGPFMSRFLKQIHQIGGKYYVNPDGHEWKRTKWSVPVRLYWKCSERLMIKYADLVVCDNRKIEEYIEHEYQNFHPKTTFIAYGTDISSSKLKAENKIVNKWFRSNRVKLKNYYLIVGRFVPENNYETMIREFMSSSTTKDLVIITNVQENVFYRKIKANTHFDTDNRIKFVGTVYNQELLKFIRENAYGYLHGHEVGGTNPSLLEALASTQINLIVNVGFNRDVAKDTAIYWNKDTGSLAKAIKAADSYSEEDLKKAKENALEVIKKEYTWPIIVQKYEELFLN
ncbi:beta 1-4 rhamnosyltransferase Cps2T [Secundilactobacillus yichangensis]|uniref:beta 1-4 rhamnosyltransferase Cps2T n=1 Tax=Secundilactobacillus yichangensis TaxID=2799580 RepID=UPI003570E9E6